MSQTARSKIKQEGRCRLCPSPAKLTRHHLVPNAWFNSNPGIPGRNHDANIVPLCRYCHSTLEGQHKNGTGIPIQVRKAEKRRQLRATLHTDETRFIINTAGADWLERNYPTVVPNHSPTPDRTPPTLRHAHLSGCSPGYCVTDCPVAFTNALPYAARLG